jgi:FkbM family methyltransferase
VRPQLIRNLLRRLKSRLLRALTPPPPVDPVRERYIRREGYIISDLVAAALPTDERFVILDGGAREALSDPRWQVFDQARVRLYGFEPDVKEVEALNKLVRERQLDYRYFAGALWSEPTERDFYDNKAPGGGSFYEQNTELTNRWKFENDTDKFYAREMFYPLGTSRWNLTSVDAWIRQQGGPIDIDFIKLNVQGAELEILRGASSIIDRVIGVMAEVSFVESYRKRPFFGDVDLYLREKGFAFFDLIGHHYLGRASSPITVRHLPGLHPLWGQLIEGHGIYFRDPIDTEARGLPVDHWTKTKLLKLVAFAEVFGQIEYAFELLIWTDGLLERRGDTVGAMEVRELIRRAEQLYFTYMK